MGTFKAIGQVKGWARRCAAGLYALSPGYLEALRGKVIILTYHRVVSKKELDAEYIQPGMYVTVETFAMQMRFIKQYFSVISFAELLRLWSEQQWSLDQRYCVVTFDDGYSHLDEVVTPVLRRHGYSAVVFVPVSHVGGANVWDASQPRLFGTEIMSEDRLRSLALYATAFLRAA